MTSWRQRFYSLLSFLAVSTVLFGIFAGVIYRRGNFVVNEIPLEIETDGASSAALYEDVQSRLQTQLNNFARKRIWDIDLRSVQTALEQEDWVRQSRIQRSFPNEVRVQVRIRRPVLIYSASRGLASIAEDGKLIENVTRQLLPDLPVLRGAVFAESEEMRKAAVELVQILPERGPLSEKNVAEISYDKEEGYLLYLMNSKTIVKLGHESFATKLARVARVLDYLQSQQLKGRVIDASFSKKVLVRLRKDS